MKVLAGFFTYLVVLNDYGYSPSILPMRGNSEFWGMQPLFCRFNGGNYVALDGSFDVTRDPSVDPPSIEYPFWFPGESGTLEDCGYAVSDYESKKSISAPGKPFVQNDSSTYGGGTKGKASGTIESYMANEQAGYFQYIPWRGRMSPFWSDTFLWWDVTSDVNSGNNYGGSESALYFRGRPAGLWSICAANDGSLGDGSGSAAIRGAYYPESALESNPSEFEFAECTETKFSPLK